MFNGNLSDRVQKVVAAFDSTANQGTDTITGTNGEDIILGGNGRDGISGNAGRDVLLGDQEHVATGVAETCTAQDDVLATGAGDGVGALSCLVESNTAQPSKRSRTGCR